MTTRGLYDCPTGAIAQSLSNCPVRMNFVMLVLQKGSYYTQVLFDGMNVFTRSRTSSGWSAWYKITGSIVE